MRRRKNTFLLAAAHEVTFPGHSKRKFLLAALFRKSSRDLWHIAVLHIRSGSKKAGMRFTGNAQKKKKEILGLAIDRLVDGRVTVDASTLDYDVPVAGWILTGDFNLNTEETRDTIVGCTRLAQTDEDVTMVSAPAGG